jgi:hypothetical protein
MGDGIEEVKLYLIVFNFGIHFFHIQKKYNDSDEIVPLSILHLCCFAEIGNLVFSLRRWQQSAEPSKTAVSKLIKFIMANAFTAF